MILIGCLVAFLLVFLLAGIAGGIFYFYFIKNSSTPSTTKPPSVTTQTTSSETSTPETTKTAAPQAKKSPEELAQKTVEAYYDNLLRGNYNDSGKYVTDRAKNDWFNPEILGQGDAELADYKILRTKKQGDKMVVVVREKYVDYEGLTSYSRIGCHLVKEGDKWLIDDMEYLGDD